MEPGALQRTAAKGLQDGLGSGCTVSRLQVKSLLCHSQLFDLGEATKQASAPAGDNNIQLRLCSPFGDIIYINLRVPYNYNFANNLFILFTGNQYPITFYNLRKETVIQIDAEFHF